MSDYVCTASKCPFMSSEKYKNCCECEHLYSVEQLVIDSLEG